MWPGQGPTVHFKIKYSRGEEQRISRIHFCFVMIIIKNTNILIIHNHQLKCVYIHNMYFSRSTQTFKSIPILRLRMLYFSNMLLCNLQKQFGFTAMFNKTLLCALIFKPLECPLTRSHRNLHLLRSETDSFGFVTERFLIRRRV